MCKHAVRSGQKHRKLLKRCTFDIDPEAAVANLALDPQDDCYVLIALCDCRVVWHLGASTSTRSCESNPEPIQTIKAYPEYQRLFGTLMEASHTFVQKCLLNMQPSLTAHRVNI